MAIFEEIESTLFREYKKDLLKRELKQYSSLKIYENQVFSLILDDSKYSHPVGDEVSAEELNNLIDFAFEDSALKAFNFYLLTVANAKVGLRLLQDPDLKSYWAEDVKLSLDITEFEDRPIYNLEFPTVAKRKKIVEKTASLPENQALLLDLWEDKLEAEGLELLKALGIAPPPQTAKQLAVLEKDYKKALPFYQKQNFKKAINVLLPLVKPLVGQTLINGRRTFEVSCNLLGLSYKELNELEAAIYWLDEGMRVGNEGSAGLNLLKIYQETQQFDKLVALGKELIFGGLKACGYTNQAYAISYTLYGALATGEDALAKQIVHYAIDLLGMDGKNAEKFNQCVQVVQAFADTQNPLAQELLGWMSHTTPQFTSLNFEEGKKWWGTLSENIKEKLLKTIKSDDNIDNPSDLTLKKISQIESLNLDDCGLKDISFISFLKKLRRLDVSENKIKEYSPLVELGDLEKLSVSENTGFSISNLPLLPKLKELDCNDCGLKTLEGVEKLVMLEEIDVSYNKITDLSPLLACKKLFDINIDENPLKPDAVLYELLQNPNIHILNYELSEEEETEIETKFPQIVNYGSNGITRYPAPVKEVEAEMPKIWKQLSQSPQWVGVFLELCYCTMNKKSQPSNEDLARLFYGRTELSFPTAISLENLEPFKFFSGIVRELIIRDAGISDLSPIAEWKYLRKLMVSYNNLEGLHALQKLEMLEYLEAKHCGLSSLQGLENCKDLRTLKVFGNQITSLEPLSNCLAIEELELSQNPILDLSHLKGLKNLKTLKISLTGNSLNLSPLADCTALEHIECIGNPGVIGLEALIGLPDLHTVITAGTVKGMEVFSEKRPEVAVC